MSHEAPGDERPARRPGRSLRRTFAALVLVSELLVVGFATLVAKDLTDVGPRTVLLAGASLMALCLVSAGLLRSPVGYALGWVVQVLLLASAVWVPTMAFLGLVFGVLWVTALVQGSRADAITAQREAAERRLGY